MGKREWEKREEGSRERGKNQGPWNYMPQDGRTFSNVLGPLHGSQTGLKCKSPWRVLCMPISACMKQYIDLSLPHICLLLDCVHTGLLSPCQPYLQGL